jgi:hypothetical protein
LGKNKERVKLDDVAIRFYLLHMFIQMNPFGFTQQIGEYKIAKLRVKFKDMNALGAKCVITYPNLFNFWNKMKKQNPSC